MDFFFRILELPFFACWNLFVLPFIHGSLPVLLLPLPNLFFFSGRRKRFCKREGREGKRETCTFGSLFSLQFEEVWLKIYELCMIMPACNGLPLWIRLKKRGEKATIFPLFLVRTELECQKKYCQFLRFTVCVFYFEEPALFEERCIKKTLLLKGRALCPLPPKSPFIILGWWVFKVSWDILLLSSIPQIQQWIRPATNYPLTTKFLFVGVCFFERKTNLEFPLF